VLILEEGISGIEDLESLDGALRLVRRFGCMFSDFTKVMPRASAKTSSCNLLFPISGIDVGSIGEVLIAVGAVETRVAGSPLLLGVLGETTAGDCPVGPPGETFDDDKGELRDAEDELLLVGVDVVELEALNDELELL
jgi:hypothetical protein